MGNCQNSERALKKKVKVLQGEMNEIMCIRESERQVYEREVMVLALKQAEWNKERKALKDEVKKLTKILGVTEKSCCCILEHIKEEQDRRDETVHKWKQLYFAIKDELDDLILRTHKEERVCWKTEEEEVLLELNSELKAKEERIKLLQAKLASMEVQESKRDREMDILRQSLRIMSHNRRTKTSARGLIQEF